MPGDFQSFVCCYFTRRSSWWSQSGSNRRPPACKAGALPAELWPPASIRSKPSRTARPVRPLSSRERVGVRVHVAARSSLSSNRLSMVGLGGLEPPASPLSGVRSNHLSYRPMKDEPQNPRAKHPGNPVEAVVSSVRSGCCEESGHGWPVLTFALRNRTLRKVTLKSPPLDGRS